MTWLDIYNQKYKTLLQKSSSGAKRGLAKDIYDRSKGFQLIFELLLQSKSNNFFIIETGTVRNPMNWKDGNSGFLFAEFVKTHGGFVESVDVDPNAVNTANSFVDNKFYKSNCSDSVTWLASKTNLKDIDLFYLDSYDVEWQNDQPSADHHLKEFMTIESSLKPGAIVAIDDNSFLLNGQRTGKGRRIYEYLQTKNIQPIFDNYQIIYKI